MFKFPLVVVAFAVTLASAVPAPASPGQRDPAAEVVDDGLVLAERNATETFEKRADPGLYVCQNIDFKEPCMPYNEFSPQPDGVGRCYKAEGIFLNSISSIGPDPGLTCIGHLRNDCRVDRNAPSLSFLSYPGIHTVAQFQQNGIDYHDRVNSISCWKD